MRTAGDQGKRLVILPDRITVQNFKRAITREGISTEVGPTIIDDIAQEILFPGGSKGRILDRNVLGQLVLQEVTHLPELQALIGNEEARELFVTEFDEYLRGTDAGELNLELTSAAGRVSDQFMSDKSVRMVDLYQQLEGKLQAKIPSSSPPIFLSRAHLVRKAREAIEAGWPDLLDVKEVLVASISVFDATTLRFLISLSELGTKREGAFRVRFFVGSGTYQSLLRRLQALGTPLEEKKGQPLVSGTSQLKDLFVGGKVEFVAAPERRREVEEVAVKVRELLLAGTPSSGILVAARTSGKYLHLVDEVFSAYGIPYHVQTRRPYAYTSAYRFVKSTLDLLVAASSSNINWKQITDPLRLGFCLPLAQGKWPIPSLAFTYLEERLSWAEHRKGGAPRSLDEWKAVAATIRWPYPKTMLTRFLEWVERQIQNPPTDAKSASHIISTMLGNYMFQMSTMREKSLSPRANPPGRFALYDDHPTRYAAEIRGGLAQVEYYIDDWVSMLNQSLDWNLLSRAYGEIFGTDTFGLVDKDLSAVRMVDVGNASFYKADVLFLMGMQVDEFPRKNPNSTFLPDPLREQLDEPTSGKGAVLYLRSSASDYGNELDFLDLALRSGPSRVICTMSYLDEEGRTVEWSSFMDVLGPLGTAVRRVSPDEWLPAPTTGQAWSDVTARTPPWVRERLFCFHSSRAFPQLAPAIDAAGLTQVSSSLDPTDFQVHLNPRLERYLRPPELITVDASEPWFSGIPLTTIVGSPLRTHEIDLHATCPLQFYFYQFLFLWRGNSVDRDAIPRYSKKGSWKYGRIPRRMSHIYPSNQTESEVIQVTLNKFPRRQQDLLANHSPSALRAALGGVLNPYGVSQFGDLMEDEMALGRQEVADNLSREWSWVASNPSATFNFPSGASVILPSHRLDTLQGSKMLVSYVNFSHQIKSEVRGIYYTHEELGGIHDPLRDSRLPILLLHYSKLGKVAGGLYAEFYNGARFGYYHHDWLPKHKGATGYSEELEMPYLSAEESREQVYQKSEWTTLLGEFQTSLERRVGAMIPNTDITFQSDVREATCNDCVYKELCQIPRSLGF